jgi:formylglycine-generating enzyme required for sulfatase activity
MDYLETAQVLAPLALWLRESHPGAGLAPRGEVENWLTEYYQDEWGLARGEARQRARGFLAAVRRYSNLLVERGEGTYGFIHLTFEEYLAAQGIAQQGQLDVEDTMKVLREHLTDPAWHETTLLTVGYLGIVQRNRRTAAAVVQGLLEADVPAAERGWSAVVAGQALRDVGAAGVTEDCRQRVLDRLISTMQDADVAPVYRRQAGLLLGWLGWQPDDLDAWVEIPAGPFLYGDREEKRLIERLYRIGKYPVTNAQFARFVKAGGYDDQRWWSQEGLAWRSGESDEQIEEEIYRDWVKRRPPAERNRPWFWDDPERANPLVPVVGVSWYEAEAYCHWLTEELRKAGALGEDEVARLPTEEEWERAARGTDGREYPWGQGFDVARANLNIGERPADGATAVMTYPGGVSPDGVWDCSGNVWEWTGSWYREGETRVLRGGSWFFFFERFARCAYRHAAPPSYFSAPSGLRVVVSARSLPRF